MGREMNKFFGSIAAVLLAIGYTASASASYLLTATDSVVFNFDLTSVSPAPPFFSTQLYPQYTGFDAGDSVIAEYFGEFDAVGPVLDTVNFNFIMANRNLSGLVDGIFSVRFTALVGSVEIDPEAEGYILSSTAPNGAIYTPRIAGVVPGGSVPVPGTVILLAVGLAGLMGVRRYGR